MDEVATFFSLQHQRCAAEGDSGLRAASEPPPCRSGLARKPAIPRELTELAQPHRSPGLGTARSVKHGKWGRQGPH